MSADREDLSVHDFMPVGLEQMAARVHELRPVRAVAEATALDRALFRVDMIGTLSDEEETQEWLAEDLIEVDTLVQFFGDPGSCKSFGALDLSLCVAAGLNWFGHPVKQGPVIYIAGEGRRGLRRRARAWALDRGIDLATLPFALSRTATALTDPMAVEEACAVIADFGHKHGDPALIVSDTLARNFGAGDENSNQDMGAAVTGYDRFRTAAHGATVLSVHHSGHGDKSRGRGAMAMRGALDHEFRFTREIDGLVRFECTKMKDGEIPQPMTFRLESVDLGRTDSRGRPVSSAVLRAASPVPAPAHQPDSAPKTSAGKGKHQRTALDALRTLHLQQVERLAKQGYDPANARVAIADWRVACLVNGVPRPRVYDIQTSLVEQGLVRIGDGYIQKIEANDD